MKRYDYQFAAFALKYVGLRPVRRMAGLGETHYRMADQVGRGVRLERRDLNQAFMVSAVFWILLALYSLLLVAAASASIEAAMGTLGTPTGKTVIGAVMFVFTFSLCQTGLTFFRAAMLWNAHATARSRTRRGEDIPRSAFPKPYDVVISLAISVLVVVGVVSTLH